MGQRPHASLGTVADVSKPRILSALVDKSASAKRSEVRCQRSDGRSRKSDGGTHRKIAMQIKSAKDLIVYQKAYALAMEIFGVSKGFPGGGKVLTYRSNPALLPVCLYESARSMGKT